MNQPTAANPAQVYEQYFVPAMFVPWATILLRHAALEPGERVLDVACGTGVVARHAAPQVADTGKVVGLDMKPAMLGVARSLPPPQGARIEWQAGPKRGPSVFFADPQRFVPLAATSSAAAVPAFAQLEGAARAALFVKVRADVDPVIARYRSEDALTFPMFAHVAIARPA
jgi:SAM-dependent methyltransferase